MNEYDDQIEQARLAARAMQAELSAEAKAKQAEREASLKALKLLLIDHAKPEFTKACGAIERAGVRAMVELGEIWQDHLQVAVMRIRISAGPTASEYTAELRGRSPDSVSASIRSPDCEANAGSWGPGAPQDLRDFARALMARFVATVRFP